MLPSFERSDTVAMLRIGASDDEQGDFMLLRFTSVQVIYFLHIKQKDTEIIFGFLGSVHSDILL